MLGSTKDSSKSSDSDDSSASLWKILSIVFGALFVVCLILTIVGFIMYNSANGDLDSAKSSNENMSSELISLKNSSEALRQSYNALQVTYTSLKTYSDQLYNLTGTLNSTISTQTSTISSLSSTNTYLWIGGGASLAGALGAGGYAFYEASQLSTAQSSLTAMTTKADHYQTYYNASYLWLIEDFVLSYWHGFTKWNLIYDSNVSWNRADLLKNITGKVNTTTFIITSNGWLMTGSLSQAWVADGNFINDSNAFLMAVDRSAEGVIPPYATDKSRYAARLNTSALIEFGDGEIIVYENHTGKATAGRTYYNYGSTISNDTFYAGENTFTATWVGVYSLIWPVPVYSEVAGQGDDGRKVLIRELAKSRRNRDS
ncbi:MAG: hypothetical protein P4M11_12335 [Candidatus Pacebacteria bacterium]|nr:hypothetical protein [Candidatus Paceibacterota bacterium]